MSHATYASPTLTGSLLQSIASAPAHRGGLTDQQIAVVRLLADGKSMKEAAALLNLTPRTIAFHKYGAMRRLKLTTSAELVRFVVKQGWV